MDPDADPNVFVIDLQDAKKTNVVNKFSAYYFLKVPLHFFSKRKSLKEITNRRNQGFSYYFCLMIEGSGSGFGSESRSIPLTSGSGTQKHMDLVDPDSDPEHWCFAIMPF